MSKISKWLRRSQKGQTATEYMLIVAVIVLGLISAASYFVPQFKAGVETLAGTVTGWLANDPGYEKPE